MAQLAQLYGPHDAECSYAEDPGHLIQVIGMKLPEFDSYSLSEGRAETFDISVTQTVKMFGSNIKMKCTVFPECISVCF